MARSFGSFFQLITQNAVAAVQDKRILRTLHTNLRWALALRSDPSDCEYMKGALPVTGRRLRPEPDPFAEPRFYTEREERAMLLDEIANLPDRVGYLWLKARSSEAFKVRTLDLDIPQGRTLAEGTEAIRSDPSIGERVSRVRYDRMVIEREQQWAESEAGGDVANEFVHAYRRIRGGQP